MNFRFLGPDGPSQESFGGNQYFQRPLSVQPGIVPTAAGLTTGTIENNTGGPIVVFGTVTSGGANDIVILPAPYVGTEVYLQGNATGYELRTTSPTTIAINGGTGADAESAIAASLTLHCRCVSETKWVCNNYAANGTEAAEEAAA